MTLPSFFGPATPLHLPAVALVAPPLGGAPTALGFSMQPQQQGNWCWAATAASVSVFFNAASSWTQCGVAGSCMGTDCCSTPSPCNVIYYLDRALTATGNTGAPASAGAFLFPDVTTEIAHGCPLGCHITWSNGGGHFVAIYGVDAATQDVDVGDPYYGNQTLPYATFIGGYRSAGAWDYSYPTS